LQEEDIPKRELPTVSRELTDTIMALCSEAAGNEVMKDQLRLAAVGVERYVGESAFHQARPEAVTELKAAEADCREVIYWLSVLTRHRMVSETSVEPAELLCQKLQRRIGGSIREREARLDEKAGRHRGCTVAFPTSRLLLRSFSGRYAVSLPGLLNEDEKSSVGLTCRDREEAQEQIAEWQTGDEMLAVIHQSDERMIGTVGLMKESYPHIRRIAVAITPDARLCGYATEALRGAHAYGFHKLGMTVAVARVRQEKTVIRKILHHIGFSEDGVLRRAADDGADLLCLSLLKEDFQE